MDRYSTPRDTVQKKHNEFINEAAETIRFKRFVAIIHHDYSCIGTNKLDDDFLEYFESNGDGHGAKYRSSRLHFARFCHGQCQFKDINASLCDRFRLYLLHTHCLNHPNTPLSHNSASAYFNAFLEIVQFAYKDGILSEDYGEMVDNIKWNHDIQKQYLTSSEIRQLASIPYEPLPEVYTAGMFAIYTGLRRSDILSLRWEDIIRMRGRKAFLRLKIKKTGVWTSLPLSLQAIRLLGEPKESGKIFPNITVNKLNTHVGKWISQAGIRKHITFHCFRHTFAMQLLNKGVDLYTISALLGHKNVASTQIYAKVTPSMIMEAIYRLED